MTFFWSFAWLCGDSDRITFFIIISYESHIFLLSNAMSYDFLFFINFVNIIVVNKIFSSFWFVKISKCSLRLYYFKLYIFFKFKFFLWNYDILTLENPRHFKLQNCLVFLMLYDIFDRGWFFSKKMVISFEKNLKDFENVIQYKKPTNKKIRKPSEHLLNIKKFIYIFAQLIKKQKMTLKLL